MPPSLLPGQTGCHSHIASALSEGRRQPHASARGLSLHRVPRVGETLTNRKGRQRLQAKPPARLTLTPGPQPPEPSCAPGSLPRPHRRVGASCHDASGLQTPGPGAAIEPQVVLRLAARKAPLPPSCLLRLLPHLPFLSLPPSIFYRKFSSAKDEQESGMALEPFSRRVVSAQSSVPN